VLCIDVEKVFNVGDTLRISGTSVPDDALVAELYNPRGALVSRTQIDVGSDGVFAKTMLQWTVPTQSFPFGTYSLVVKSSINEERRVTEALRFQLQEGTEIPENVERNLAVQISAPPVVGINENAKVIVQVTVNNILFKGDPTEMLKDSHIHFPDGSVKPIDTFTVLEDGVYIIDFSSKLLGLHTIHIEAFQEEFGLIANSVSGVLVQEGSVSSLSKEVSELNTNVDALRQETVEKTEELGSSVSRIESASGQVTSLLLPIIGMIAIIVALQATMLAKRK
jgi:hypothetical protein